MKAIAETRGAGMTPDESALSHVMRVIYNRRDDALIVFGIVFGLSLLYTYLTPRVYEARAQLVIESASPNVVSFPEVVDQNRSSLDYYQTQYRILQSRSLAKRALDAGQFWRHPQLQPVAPGGFPLSPRAVMATVRSAIGRFTGGASPRPAGETDDQARVIDAFLAGLAVAPVRNSRVVEVRYRSTDPTFAAAAANALSKAYLAQNLEQQSTASREATTFLLQQIAEQQQAVEASELALQKYREDYDALSLEEHQNIVVQRLADLNAALTRARTERIAREADYERLQEIQRGNLPLDAFPAVLANGFIQQLKVELAALQREEAQRAEQYGDRHPELIQVRSAIATARGRVQDEIGQVAQSVRNEFLAAQAQERSIQASLNEQKAAAQTMNRRAIEYGVLARTAKTNRDLSDALLQRTKETGISGDLQTTNIRILDHAEVPRAPSYPSTSTNLLLGLVAGIVLALGFVFVLDLLDNRIKSPGELKATLQLPYLGSIPISADSRGGLLVNNGVGPAFAESMRSLTTNVLFSAPPGGSRSILVTSTAPGEGKTVVAANLALSLARAGQRVLLVDADMRRPRLHELFHVSRQPGLSDVISGTAKPSDAIRKTGETHAWILPAGAVLDSPPELLRSRRFTELLKTLGEHFDWVILDSPPVAGMTDAAVIGHQAGGVLFVVGSEMTSRAAARTALEQLDSARVTYVGAVLNRMDPDGHPYYYYPSSQSYVGAA